MKTSLLGILRLLGQVSERCLVKTDTKKCMRCLNKSSTCTLCYENCPSGAIKMDNTDDVISVDGTSCTGCGICVNVCPACVFWLEDVDFQTIIKEVGDMDRVTFSCSKGDCDIQVPCLGYLNEAVLLYLASSGVEVELNISACKACENRTAYDLIHNYVDTVNSILQTSGKVNNVTIEEDGALKDTEPEQLTRKFMARFAANSTTNTDVNGTNLRQSLFIEALRKLDCTSQKTIHANGVPFGNIKVGSSCNGCGMCAAICQADALSTIEGREFKLEFRPAMCTGCGLCSQICTQGSITMDTEIPINEVLQGDWKKVVEMEKVRCEKCGEYCIRSADSNLCMSCQKNKEIEDTFFS